MPSMDLQSWIANFAQLHEKAKGKSVAAEDLKAYREGREELARAMVAAQGLALKAGETPRHALRVARAYQVNLLLSTGRVHALTLDISTAGFATLLRGLPMASELVAISLNLPNGREPVLGQCKLVANARQQGVYRCSFGFHNVSEPDMERIEMIVFDAVLETLHGGR